MGFNKIVAAVLASGTVLSIVPSTVMADSTGWQQDLWGWRYYVSGDGYVKNDWKQIGGEWYYFLENGYMVSEIDNIFIDGVFYSFDESGACLNPYESKTKLLGWHEIEYQIADWDNGGMDYKCSWCYFEPDGNMAKGWRRLNGYWYYFDPKDSSMYDIGRNGGWPVTIDGAYYYFLSDGKMLTGWHCDYDVWHYADENGHVYIQKWLFNGGNWYYFNDLGEMLCSVDGVEINGVEYSFDENGVCLNPYGDSDGHEAGWCRKYNIERRKYCWYYYNEDGSMYTGWLTLNGKTYYLDPEDGAMLTDNQFVDGNHYCFSESGEMITGWFKFSGYYGYAGPDGAAYSEKWVCSGGKWYYINNKGFNLADCVNITINGIDYSFDSDGVCLNPDAVPEQHVGWYFRSYYNSSNWYYYDSDGEKCFSKWVCDAGNWYYIGPDSTMVSLESNYLIDGLYYDFDENGICLNPYSGRDYN